MDHSVSALDYVKKRAHEAGYQVEEVPNGSNALNLLLINGIRVKVHAIRHGTRTSPRARRFYAVTDLRITGVRQAEWHFFVIQVPGYDAQLVPLPSDEIIRTRFDPYPGRKIARFSFDLSGPPIGHGRRREIMPLAFLDRWPDLAA